MMDLLYRLRRFLMEHQLFAGNIKITVEFTDPETQFRAESLLRRNVSYTDPMLSLDMIDALCNERPVTFMGGIIIQAKRFEYPKRPSWSATNCQCGECVRLRNFRQDAIDK